MQISSQNGSLGVRYAKILPFGGNKFAAIRYWYAVGPPLKEANNDLMILNIQDILSGTNVALVLNKSVHFRYYMPKLNVAYHRISELRG
jgi:hypothetical protein